MSATLATIVIRSGPGTPISPYIYGANFPDWDALRLPFPLARQGGNRMSAYNWETNASNAGADWHHQNDAYMAPTDEPGFVGRTFLRDAQRHGAAAILTVPMTGYVAADKKGDGDVAQTADYLKTRFFRSEASKPGAFAYPPDTTDAVVYQDEYVAWIERIKKPAPPVWYALDNEADLWNSTHNRIWPQPPTYASFLQRSIEYARALKKAAPTALILGPVSYGWQGFRRFQNAPDANERDFLDFYLAGMRDAGRKAGRRLLDGLDIHFYPEARGGGVRITEESRDPATARARIQTPRSLWDPTYVEDSWITQSLGGKAIVLLPRVRAQIARHYPGTKLAVTEYHYGGRNDISGALAQADVLGIYGRYGVYAACIWGFDPKDRATRAGFAAFLDLDGKGARFGDLGLGVGGETPSADSVYAARDSKNPRRLTVVAINKTEDPRTFVLKPAGFVAKSARTATVTAAALERPVRGAATVRAGTITVTAPPLSVVSIDARA
jgi:hypothetical protein